MADKELLFKVTAKDCDFEPFKSSGPGGQHRNKTCTAIRCRHKASGAVAEASEHKSQWSNKQAAFERMAQTPEFQAWHRLETARRLGILADIEQKVDDAMLPENLKVEIKVDGKWVEVDPDEVPLS